MQDIKKLSSQLKDIPFVKNNPLEPLFELFGNKSLEKWLKKGFLDALIICIRELLNFESCKGYPNGRVKRCIIYMAIMNEILPDVSKSFEEKLEGKFMFQRNLMLETTPELMDELIQKCFPVACLFMKYSHNIRCENINTLKSTIMIKLLFHIKKEKLEELEKDTIQDFFVRLDTSTLCVCHSLSQLLVSSFLLLSYKKPLNEFAFMQEKNMRYKLAFKLKVIMMNNSENKFPLLKEFKQLYAKHTQFENVLESHQDYIQMTELNETPDIATYFTLLSRVVDYASSLDPYYKMDRSIFILNLGVLKRLKPLLVNSDANMDHNIKLFLKIFLDISSDENVQQINCNTKSYRQLINMLKISCRHSFRILSTIYSVDNPYDWSYNNPQLLEENIVDMSEMLQVLYELNYIWYEFFDLPYSKNILTDEELRAAFMTGLVYDLYKSKQESLKNLAIKLSIFPAMGELPRNPNKSLQICMNNRNPGLIEIKINRNLSFVNVKELFDKHSQVTNVIWTFDFEGEIGAGIGAIKEAYDLISQEIRRSKIWQEEQSSCLFPDCSEQNLDTFVFIGKLLAKAFLDERRLDIPFSEEFFRRMKSDLHVYLRPKRGYCEILKTIPTSAHVVQQLISTKRRKEIINSDCNLTNDQKKEMIEGLTFEDGSTFNDLYLNFTFPGTNSELIENGYNILVTPWNVEEYLAQLSVHREKFDSTRQFKAIRDGFEQILPNVLNVFAPDELKLLICYDQCTKFTIDDLYSFTSIHLPYSTFSKAVEFLFQTLVSLDQREQKLFLQFVTGSSSLPYGGLKELNPRLTIIKSLTDNPDGSLPRASTCSNHFHLPGYSSLDITKQKLLMAINEGSYSFY